MAANRSAFPKSPRRALWEAVLKRLKADPVLTRCVQTWYALDGLENPDRKRWSLTQLPAVSVVTIGRGASWYAIRDFKAPIVFQIDFAIASTNEGDLLDMWTAIEQALFGGGEPNSILSQMRQVVQGVELIGCGVTPQFICDGKALASEGQVLFNFHRFI